MEKKNKSPQKLSQLKPTNIQISPDGKYLSYFADDNDGNPQLRLRTTGQQDDQVLSLTKNKTVVHYQWSYLPNTLLYIQDTGGNNKHLYSLNVKTNVRRCLTPFVVQDNPISPRIIAVSPCNRSEVLVELNLDNPNVHDVYRIDLITGALSLDTKNPGDVTSWVADIALNIRAKNVIREDGVQEIHYRDYFNRSFGDWTLVTGSARGEGCFAVSISALTGELYFLVQTRNLILFTYDTRAKELSVIYDDVEKQLCSIEINSATRDVVKLYLKNRTPDVTFLCKEREAEHAQLKEIRNRKYSVLSRTLENDLLVVASHTKRGNAKYALFNKTTNQLKTL